MKPITRKEMLMAKAAGQDVPDITPVTREEYFLNQIANGGGGGGGGGNLLVTLTFDEQAQTAELNASFNELRAAYEAGRFVLFLGDAIGENGTYHWMTEISDENEYYTVTFKPTYSDQAGVAFVADDPNAHMMLDQGN